MQLLQPFLHLAHIPHSWDHHQLLSLLCISTNQEDGNLTVQCLNYLSSLITLQILEECMLGMLIFKMAESIMHMSISAPTGIDQQAKGQNCNLLVQPVCRLRSILTVIHLKKWSYTQTTKTHPDTTIKDVFFSDLSLWFKLGSLQKTSWQPRFSRRSPNTSSAWQSRKASHWAIHKLVIDSWSLMNNLWATVNVTYSHASVRNFSWETGWHCLSLSFTICTRPKDQRNKSARNDSTGNESWNFQSMPALQACSSTQHDTVRFC